MGARQREMRSPVVKRRGLPHRRRMALCTVMTEVAGHVVRVGGPVEVGRVALVTVGVLQLVVPVDVARLALHSNVSACQREPCRIVIECCALPVRR